MSSVGPLLAVKHGVPPARSTAVARPRLTQLLTDAADTRLCVVVAPAGWGKTTLLAQWADAPAQAGRVAWVSLDESDDEPVRFWAYVLTALGELDDALGGAALSALGVPGVDPLDVAVPTLLNQLAAAHGSWVLVLDDYHVISHRGIHEALEFLLAYLPVSLRVVVAGRADPPLPLARMRAKAELTEVRLDDLRLTSEESDAVVTVVAGVGLEPSAADAVWRRTEGWAAGVQLVGLAVRASSEPSATASQMRGDDRHLLDYLSVEVLDRLDAEQRDLLVRTSVLDRLSGPLCDAVLGRSGSGAVLLELDRRSLFVAAVDRRRHWYRCHGLLRDVLRRELDASADTASTAVLLRRASQWYAGQGEVDEAVRLLIAARDATAATALLHASEEWFFSRGGAATYLQLGEQVEQIAPVDEPDVLVLLAYAAVLSGRFDRVGHWCDAAERAIPDTTVSLDGWSSARACVLTLRAAYGPAETQHPDLAVAQASEAVHLEADPGLPGYVVARIALASALMRAERPDDAVTALREAWTLPVRGRLPLPVILQGAGLFALVLWQAGKVDDARRVCLEVTSLADTAERTWASAAASCVTWLRLVQGRLAHRDGDASAVPVLTRAVELAEVWGRDTDVVMALTSLAEAQLASDRAAARTVLTRAREVADNGSVRPAALRGLAAVETRVGRGAVRAARRRGGLDEELTDRELSILRALAGSSTQREIGDALFLSVNTVKGYAKSLYRKLGTTSRLETVERARDLGLV